MGLSRLLRDKSFPFFRGLANFSLEADVGDILSMDDETTGGRRFHVLSFSFDAKNFYERIGHPRAGRASVTQGSGRVWIDADTLLRDRLTLEVEGQDLLDEAFQDIYQLTYSLYDSVKIPIAGATPATELEKMLGQAPDNIILPVTFVDVAGQLLAAGLSHITALDALTKEELGRLNHLTRPCMAVDGYYACDPLWGETFGFTVLGAARSIGIGPSPSPLRILNGNFDPDLISAKLQAQGYEVKAHEGQLYYSQGSDYLRPPLAEVRGQIAGSSMNRVAATERALTRVTTYLTQRRAVYYHVS